MPKIAVAQALMRIADSCFQIIGETGRSSDSIVEQVSREVRAYCIHHRPAEVHE